MPSQAELRATFGKYGRIIPSSVLVNKVAKIAQVGEPVGGHGNQFISRQKSEAFNGGYIQSQFNSYAIMCNGIASSRGGGGQCLTSTGACWRVDIPVEVHLSILVDHVRFSA